MLDDILLVARNDVQLTTYAKKSIDKTPLAYAGRYQQLKTLLGEAAVANALKKVPPSELMKILLNN